ncbi:hypothetical protein HPB49_015477 [Dermacentor silvarum]|uniref:Uncharacterized protein n=1 Tax=Dermacentor silvarum TaxID=543639 RepID=A0ACB8C480_DERSI|nr:hypothetical protein HPB49_015477 [Dermacentor silvarum]
MAEVALAAPTATVVCTVSNLVPPSTSALPPDGACDLLFFESFYKDDKNNLAGGYGSLELNARVFLEQAAKANKTQYGASFAFTQMTWKTDFITKNFYEAIDDIWNRKIHHFGFLNLYRDFSAPGVVTKALLALKELYIHVKRINRWQQPSYQILGLSIDFEENFTTVNLMSLQILFSESVF